MRSVTAAESLDVVRASSSLVTDEDRGAQVVVGGGDVRRLEVERRAMIRVDLR